MFSGYETQEDYEKDIYGVCSDSESSDEELDIERELYQQIHYTSNQVNNQYNIESSQSVESTNLNTGDSVVFLKSCKPATVLSSGTTTSDTDASIIFVKSINLPKKRQCEDIIISSDSDFRPSKKCKKDNIVRLKSASQKNNRSSSKTVKSQSKSSIQSKGRTKGISQSECITLHDDQSNQSVISISSDDESEWMLIDDVSDSGPELMTNLTNLWTGQTTPSKEWNVSMEDMMNNVQNSEGRVKIRNKRYFTSKSSIRCHKCGECGHLSKTCTKPRIIPACYLCGETGHSRHRCPNELCFICEQPGHQKHKCSERWKERTECYRCHQTGHIDKECPDIWRQYHLTVKHGTINQAPLKKKKVPTATLR